MVMLLSDNCYIKEREIKRILEGSPNLFGFGDDAHGSANIPKEIEFVY
jgi:hypothetical protein